MSLNKATYIPSNLHRHQEVELVDRNSGDIENNGKPSFIAAKYASKNLGTMILNGAQVYVAAAKIGWRDRIVNLIIKPFKETGNNLQNGIKNDFGKRVADAVFNKFKSDLDGSKPLSARAVQKISDFIADKLKNEIRLHIKEFNSLVSESIRLHPFVEKNFLTIGKPAKVEKSYMKTVEKSMIVSEKQFEIENQLAKLESSNDQLNSKKIAGS